MSGDAEFTLEISSRREAARRVRRELERDFGPRLAPAFLADLALVLSELVNNSVIHGPGGLIRVRLGERDDGEFQGEVEDGGNGQVVMLERLDERELTKGGLGLRIVDALVDRWGVYPNSTHVWFAMRPSRARSTQTGSYLRRGEAHAVHTWPAREETSSWASQGSLPGSAVTLPSF